MNTFEYRKNGQAWQDQLKIGDEVMVHKLTPQSDGLCSVSCDRTRITSLGSGTITTLEGEIFEKSSLKSVDFAKPNHELLLCPAPEDHVASFMIPRPTIEELMLEGMLEEEAQDWLDAIIEMEKEDNI